MKRADTAIQRIGQRVDAGRSAPAAAKCRCGGLLAFSTDTLGRTVEECPGCQYSGAVRPVARMKPVTVARRRTTRRIPRDPHRFRCGHPRSPENTARHRLGWDECRICSRERAKRSRRSAA